MRMNAITLFKEDRLATPREHLVYYKDNLRILDYR
jgi:hypothetical protein